MCFLLNWSLLLSDIKMQLVHCTQSSFISFQLNFSNKERLNSGVTLLSPDGWKSKSAPAKITCCAINTLLLIVSCSLFGSNSLAPKAKKTPKIRQSLNLVWQFAALKVTYKAFWNVRIIQHQAKGISSKHLIPQNSITVSLACFGYHLFHSAVISKHAKWWSLPLGIYCKVQKKTEETLLQMLHHSILPLKRETRDTLPLLFAFQRQLNRRYSWLSWRVALLPWSFLRHYPWIWGTAEPPGPSAMKYLGTHVDEFQFWKTKASWNFQKLITTSQASNSSQTSLTADS